MFFRHLDIIKKDFLKKQKMYLEYISIERLIFFSLELCNLVYVLKCLFFDDLFY